MIRQGIIPYNFVNKAANQKVAAPSFFQDAFFADAAVNSMRANILKMEKQNVELEDEIQHLRYNLNKVEGLQNEIMRKEEQMNEKNDLINNLNTEKSIIEQEKAALNNEMEQLKIKQILVKNVTMLSKQNAEKDAEREKELNELQTQNAQLREQVISLQKLQIQTVTGGSVLETKQNMEELPKDAFRPEDIEEIFGAERSSSSIIASYIQRFETLVKDAENEEERDATPLLSVNGTDVTEDEPQVVDLSAANEDEAPEVREVVENGTNMSFTPDHEEILERERLHEAQLEEARDEVAA